MNYEESENAGRNKMRIRSQLLTQEFFKIFVNNFLDFSFHATRGCSEAPFSFHIQFNFFENRELPQNFFLFPNDRIETFFYSSPSIPNINIYNCLNRNRQLEKSSLY